MTRLSQLVLISIIGLQFFNAGNALPDDRDKPINGKALTTTLDANTGKTVLTGKVQISQGALSIHAEKVVIDSDPQTNKLTYLIATGSPVTLLDTPNTEQEPIKIQGQQIEFYPLRNQIITLGNAVITQAGNTAKGERIQYDTVTGIMIIESDIVVNSKANGEQAEFVLQPGATD